MASPFVAVRVTRTYTDLEGTAAVDGAPIITLSETISDGVSETLVPGALPCTINTSGQLVGPDGAVGVALVALDQTATSTPIHPNNAKYAINGEPGQVEPRHFILTAAMAPTVDLATLFPTLEDS